MNLLAKTGGRKFTATLSVVAVALTALLLTIFVRPDNQHAWELVTHGFTVMEFVVLGYLGANVVQDIKTKETK